MSLHIEDIRRVRFPDSKVHGANMGPACGRQDPGGPHVGHMNLAIWVILAQQGGAEILTMPPIIKDIIFGIVTHV